MMHAAGEPTRASTASGDLAVPSAPTSMPPTEVPAPCRAGSKERREHNTGNCNPCRHTNEAEDLTKNMYRCSHGVVH